MSTGGAESDDLSKAKDFLGRVRAWLKAPPPELEGRAGADIRFYLLVITCLICGIVGGWVAVKNRNLYVHGYHPGYEVFAGGVAGLLAMSLGLYGAQTYKPNLMLEIPAWAGFGIGLIDVLWLAGPAVFSGPGAG